MKNIAIIVLTFLSFLGLLMSCTNQETDNGWSGIDTLSIDSAAVPQNQLVFYKHYRGKLDDKIAISMDLIADGQKVKGTYYYENGKPLKVEGEVQKNGFVILAESVDGQNTGRFEGKIEEKSFKGTWSDKKGEKSYAFVLDEDYTKGSVMFDIFFFKDSVLLLKDKINGPYASYEQTALLPKTGNSADVSELIMKSITNFNFDTKDYRKPVAELLKQRSQKYFNEYTELAQDYDEELGKSSFMWSSSLENFIVYNENNYLVIGNGAYEYSGGAHGNYGTSYVVFDLLMGDSLKLTKLFKDDKMDVLAEKITNKLKQQFNLEKGASLGEAGFMVEGNVEPTKNFYITKEGITFVYPPYAIAAYALGEIEVSLTFKELNSILKNKVLE